MKRMFLCLLVTVLLLAGCGGTSGNSSDSSSDSERSEITIDGIEQAIQKADSSFTFDGTPMYQAIGAENGWMGYFGDSVVKVYEYADDEAYEKALSDYSVVGKFVRNGNFVLETSNETVSQIFSSFNGDLDAVVVPEAPEAAEVVAGQVYTIPDLCEFTVNYAELKKEVLPPNPGSFYNYYQEEDGSTYLDVSVSIKNTRTTARTADQFGVVKVICGDGYEYDTFSTIEESGGGNFTYTNITNIDPLMTGVVHYIASIPNELADDSTVSISLDMSILDNEYTMTVR